MPEAELRFAFGKNWEKFVRASFNDDRARIAEERLLEFLGLEDFRGKYFLDIGCGSGIHSLAAHRAQADLIVSFDLDPLSVATTEKLRALAGRPANWEVRKGSILDDAFVTTLEAADIVYSWGVLHHTGDLWKAMQNAVRLMKEDGVFFAALYDYEAQTDPPPEFWLDVKRSYCGGSWFTRRKMELWYVWRFGLGGKLSGLPQLLARIRGYKGSRGMAFYTDLVDWLGGWPMEFAKREDVRNWARVHSLDIVKMKTGEANTEYLFARAERRRSN